MRTPECRTRSPEAGTGMPVGEACLPEGGIADPVGEIRILEGGTEIALIKISSTE